MRRGEVWLINLEPAVRDQVVQLLRHRRRVA